MSVKEIIDIDLILKDLANNEFQLTAHARKRMQKRFVSRNDIRTLPGRLITWEKQKNGSFKLKGTDLDRDELTVICVYDDGTLIVTVY